MRIKVKDEQTAELVAIVAGLCVALLLIGALSLVTGKSELFFVCLAIIGAALGVLSAFWLFFKTYDVVYRSIKPD